MTAAVAQARPHLGHELLSQAAEGSHIVQFYQDEAFLCDVVAGFLAAGLQAEQPLLVIATEPHRAAFVARLEAKGFHIERARDNGRLILLDARETLAKFMRQGMPDQPRFQEVIGKLLDGLATGRQIRAYGEMVDLLWRDGKPQAAVQLEAQWNETGSRYSLSLLCAYGMGNFHSGADGEQFQRICQAHSHVLPTENYSKIEDTEARLREVSLLQQRAQALESEIEQRKRVETALTEALRSRDDFLSVASHELRTPLTSLQLYMQSLAIVARDGDGRVQSRVGKASEQIKRLSDLVEQLLDVPRVTTLPLPLHREPFDLALLVREVADQAYAAAAHAGSRLQVLTEEPLRGSWDRGRIEQALTKLLANAIKYGRGEPIELLVKQTQGCAQVRVRDHGIGIADADQARIFERFERAADRHNFGGLGLGLWIARQIAEAHGGALRVESSLGDGATFTIELPL